MSTTTDTGATLIAAALLDEARDFADHTRLHLGPLFGITPQQIFDALITTGSSGAASTSTAVSTAIGTLSLRGLPLSDDPDEMLVPYLVGQPGITNAGSAGFAAVLRDEVPVGPGKKVLLILDAKPVETVRTTSLDATQLGELQWAKLLDRALDGPRTALLNALLADSARLAANAETINELVAMAANPATVGDNLHKLGVYIRDPLAGSAPVTRLKKGAKWRERLGTWSAPDKDTRALIRGEYDADDDPRATRVISAIGAFGMDYGRFTLDDLPDLKPKGRLSLATPPRARGAAYVSSARNIAVWAPGGAAFSLVLTGKPRATDRARILWSTGEEAVGEIQSDSRELTITPPNEGNGNWLFADVEIGGSAGIKVAVCTADGNWFPFEADLNIDTQQGAFEVQDTPRVLCLDPQNKVVGGAELETVEVDVSPTLCVVRRGSDAGQLWLVANSLDGDADDDAQPDEPSADKTTDEGDPSADDDPDGADEENDLPSGGDDMSDLEAQGSHSSVSFALLVAARTVPAVELEADFKVVDGQGFITTSSLSHLHDQTLSASDRQFNGLDLEAQILANPQTLTWEFDHSSASAPLVANDRLERYVLDDLDQGAVQVFLKARADFFVALTVPGSAHALGAGHALNEARAYSDAYHALLKTVGTTGTYRAELDRLILIDSITDPVSGDIYIAPTNPVTVAFLLQLNEAVQGWLPRASEVVLADLRSITPRHLIPTFALNKTWYESKAGAPLPWRLYRPRGSVTQESDGQHAYIALRIRHFLRVNPHYNDRRQTLSLTFFEPGSGAAVLEALKDVFAKFVAAGNLEAVPLFSVTLINKDKSESDLELFLASSTSTPPPPKEVGTTRLMRDKIRVTSQPRSTAQDFAHIAFVFRSPLDRSQSQFRLAARSGTLWVSGLAATPGRLVTPGANETTYAWGTFTGYSPSGHLSRLVHTTLNLVGGMPREQLAPDTTRMPSTRTSTAFLDDIYEQSVWVVHLDRLLGLEAFTPKNAPGRVERYLIDYEDRADPAQPGLDAITATKWIDPYRRTLSRSLQSLGSPSDRALDNVLRLFNSVSGRWALDLIGKNWNVVSERVGLAATIASLDALDNAFKASAGQFSVLIPVKELLDSLPRAVVSALAGRHSDDLLQLVVDTTSNVVRIYCRVIEVKYRTSTDNTAPLTARTQIGSTAAWLEKVFNSTGPSRGFRSRDLAELVRGAVTRAEAFDMLTVTSSQREALEQGLDRVAAGVFELSTSYEVGGQRQHGEFFSIEPESSVSVHRQDLQGTGLPMGYVRLGRPVLEALARGERLPAPSGWQPPTFPMPEGTDPGGPDSGGPDSGGPDSGGPDSGGPDSGGPDPNGGEPQPDGDTATGAPNADVSDPHTPSGDTDEGEDIQPEETDDEHTEEPDPLPDPEHDDAAADDERPVAPQEPEQLSSHAWADGAEEEVYEFAAKLDAAFARYALSVEPFDPELVQVGPSLLRFRTRAMGRLSITDVERRERDISREVGASGPVAIGDEPGFVTVDVPRSHRQTVLLDALLPELDARPGKPGALNFVAGVAPSGEIRIADLSRLPHLLVAGATGSGKSVFLRGMILELLRARSPEQLSLLIVDPKRLDFAPFAAAPHLQGGRIIHDTEEALEVLSETLTEQLAWRQPILERAGVSSAAEFYETGGRLEDLPQLVIVVDEFADLILGGTDRKAFSELIQRFAQLTRAYGIFLVLATQRPSVDVITGSIKANLSARIAFSLPSGRDSMTVLDQSGAEDLLGDGDLLFYNAGRTERLQAPFVRPADVRSVLDPR